MGDAERENPPGTPPEHAHSGRATHFGGWHWWLVHQCSARPGLHWWASHQCHPTGRGPGRIALLLALLAVGCSEQDMVIQPKIHRPYQETEFFDDRQSARPLVAHTVALDGLRIDRAFYEGKAGDELIDEIPVRDDTHPDRPIKKVDLALLSRGRERFDIYCAPCHGRTGDGQGMIVKRGFSPPPTFHQARLRDVPTGHFFSVITHGYGAMYSYASRVPPDDRWAIAAYIRALQYSQQARLDDVPPSERPELEKAK